MSDLISKARALVAGATQVGSAEWHVDCDEGYSGVIVDDESNSIAHVEDITDDATWIARQDLIAQAPTLLAELADALEAATSECAIHSRRLDDIHEACCEHIAEEDEDEVEAIRRAGRERLAAILAAEAAESRAAQMESRANVFGECVKDLFYTLNHKLTRRPDRDYLEMTKTVRAQIDDWRCGLATHEQAEEWKSRAAQAEAMVQELIAALPTEDEHDAIRECTSESEYSPRVHESLGQGRDERRKVWDYLSRYAIAARKVRK